MRNLLIVFCMTVATIIVGGCAAASQGRKFDDTYVSQIRKGVTTKAMIRQHFGEPVSTTKSSDFETWTYSYSDAYGRGYIQGMSYGLVREKSDDQLLILVFQGDVVAEYTYTK
ncbi:outer membrane protein assembly factor BamE [Methylomonas koyamae]|uniref:outer membrane protein assembly factor BamE domain-containing protein n=1 Tax=Methylomonas koyamae TaxID=702114 RepID=UPI00112E9D09|nr:outer membrane protein assembly factor BamE [Methylomonas koyamae]TPQ25613.1 hypothetical protein C2U68_14610 [Methylomonas koyamae]